MKKLLNISVIAALAILPLAASATDLTQTQMDYAVPTTADNTTVATTAYVKGAYHELGTAINTKQDKLEQAQLSAISDVSGLKTRVDTLETTVGDADRGLVQDVNGLKTTVGDSSTGLAKDVADLKTGKADKETTLSGYGITDAYTKTEADGLLANKANSADVYTKEQVDTSIAGSANTATYSNEATYTPGTVGAAIKTLETASGDYATKTGVVATVNAATATATNVSLTVGGTPTGDVNSTLSVNNLAIPTSATVPTLTTWGNDESNGTATVSLTTTSTPVTGTVTSTFSGTGINGGTATGTVNSTVSVTGGTAGYHAN